jgi:hypothetical protein
MAVTATNRISSELSIDEEGYRTYSSVWEVLTNAVTDGPITVLAAAGLPAIGSTYSWTDASDTEAIRTPLTGIKLRSVEQTRKIWRVNITHTTKLRTCLTSAPTDPLSIPIKIRGGWAAKTKIATEDKDGEPLLNSAEDPITPGVEIDDNDDTVIIECNTATLSLATRNGFKNKLNSNTMWGCGPRTIKFRKWDYELLYHGACLVYFHNVLEFAINLDGWDPKILDAGFNAIIGVDDDGYNIYDTITSDKDKGPLNHPKPLDGAGHQTLAADPYAWLEPEVMGEADFSTLGLPDPLW